MPEAFRLVVALIPSRNIIVIYSSYNPQTSAPDTRLVGRLVTVRTDITICLILTLSLLPVPLSSSLNFRRSVLSNHHAD